MTFAVDHGNAKLTCVYKTNTGPFTTSLAVGECFSSYLAPSSGETLHASIAANMKILHPHMLSHLDQLFLLIKQTPKSTEHQYQGKKPDDLGVPYVRYTRNHGSDFVGHEKVNIGKAEVPGVSWKS